jgi:hypothetical protein
LTLEFGDAVASFSCDACGPTEVHGKRVVLVDAPRVHAVLHFTAKVR